MHIIRNESLFSLPGSVVSIGMFDGVHRGHRRLLQALREQGRRHRLPSVVVTFDPHPRALLRPGLAPPLLTVLDDRMQLLRMTGAVDYCLVLPFDVQRAAQSADSFVAATLVARLGISALVVGENFRCGSGRKGDVAYLKALGAAHGYEVQAVRLRSGELDGAVYCSSTEVRRLIQAGDLCAAAAMLGRPHGMSGIVAALRGSRRRMVDVIVPDAMCLPAAGDYAGIVGKKGGRVAWMRAALRVEPGCVAGRRAVRLHVGGEPQLAAGDDVLLRFLGQARRPGHPESADIALAA
jgi:riboflavin kinase/FMN adenylyltransferase